MLLVALVSAVAISMFGNLAKSYAQEFEKGDLISDEAYRVFEEAERLKAEGHGDEAARLFEKAWRVEAEFREKKRHEEEPREREERVISEEAHRLFEKAERLKEEGRREDAEELWRKAERIETEARERRARGEKREREERVISEEAHMLFEKAERLKEEGRRDEAEELWHKAERIEAEARERREREQKREPERQGLLEEAHRLFDKAARLEEEGRHEEAEELRRKAQDIEREADRREGRRGEAREKEEPIIHDQVIQYLRRELIGARMELDELSQRYGRKHPRMQTTEDRIRTIEKSLANEKAERLKKEYEPVEKGMPPEQKMVLAKARAIKKEPERKAWRQEIEQVIREHLEVARRLKEEGRGGAAEKHLGEVERLKRELKEAMLREREVHAREPHFPKEGQIPPRKPFVRMERPTPPRRVLLRKEAPTFRREPPVRKKAPTPHPILAEIGELRHEMNGMREELAEIKRLLHKLLQR